MSDVVSILEVDIKYPLSARPGAKAILCAHIPALARELDTDQFDRLQGIYKGELVTVPPKAGRREIILQLEVVLDNLTIREEAASFAANIKRCLTGTKFRLTPVSQ